ncbi:hypothetical protein JOC37_000674, partial [Desulfohalotomaculum tongense]|nr:hypothetical protein [Desulforadius tongensis]
VYPAAGFQPAQEFVLLFLIGVDTELVVTDYLGIERIV